jgi:cytoplasmic iron level regulating protein YaaA (DUF328/UPF0246 family)
MLILISPAKTLDFETAPQTKSLTAPEFHDQAAKLMGLLRPLSVAQIASLMDLSAPLADLNHQRYQVWQANPQPSLYPHGIKQAVLAFDGDVYDGLKAKSMSGEDLDFAQQHLRILSGLYGLLLPFDLIQPHRLEMGTRLRNPRGKRLIDYWRPTVTQALNRQIAQLRPAAVINLASDEYFSVLDHKALEAPLIQAVFEEKRGGGEYKVISFMAKQARGAMSRFAILNRITDPADLKAFAEDGYAFAPTASNSTRWVFRRS